MSRRMGVHFISYDGLYLGSYSQSFKRLFFNIPVTIFVNHHDLLYMYSYNNTPWIVQGW